ncbi:LamG-like jellyroll fold domain-containing protein [Planctomycetota bacterium]
MKRLNGDRMRLVVFGIAAGIVFGGGIVKADFTFGEPVNLGPTVNSSSGDAPDCISYDGLELYFDSNRSGGYGGWDLWVSTRETIDDDWGAPVNLGPEVNTSRSDACAIISADGLELYFTSYNRSGGYGGWDVWVTRRSTKDEAWGTPVNLGPPINSSADEGTPNISPDGLELYFGSIRPGGYGSDDIWVSKRATKNDPWGEPMNLGPIVNSPSSESITFLSPNGLLLFFSEDTGQPIRSGGFGNIDLWVTRRSSVSDPWGTPVNLGPIVNTSSLDGGPVISFDGSTLYFASERPGGYGGAWGDIYQSQIIPLIDLNADGIVDATDMCIVVDHWGENYSLCDIGPTPLGDGIVDVEDLVALSEHLFKEVDDPTLVAHWPLDEAEGMVVADGAGGNDGNALGDPVWLHDGGQVNGALHLDGVDDYVVTGAAPTPEGNSYSVLAWIKGGAPGQVVLSQMGTADWLCANPSAGTLMTELTMAGRDGSSLDSEAIITDGNWHRIGFVWDGSYRRLYVDGVIVAEDVQDNLDVSSNGFYFGTGKGMESGTFFSGLIDDVRIYNRVVYP